MEQRREALYLTLGVSPGASVSTLKRAYRRAAKRCHPDVCADADAIERFLDVQNAYEELLAESGSLQTVGHAEWRNKWRKQVENLRSHAQERAEDREDREETQREFESEEERLAYQAMRRSVDLYEAQGNRERVLGQLDGLKGRDARKKRVRKVAKPTWKEPFDDDPWYHGVQ